jgi:dephospho-CoA kinase
MFRERGVAVVDADLLAREVTAPGSEGLAAIVERFGVGVLDADGALDRKKLGALVFADEEARAAINRITHPRIAAVSQRELARHREAGEPLAIYEAALIVENQIQAGMDALIVVSVDPATQLERLMARDRISEADGRARIDAQLPLADKVAVADHVIDNSGDRAETELRVDAVLAALRDGGLSGPSQEL